MNDSPDVKSGDWQPMHSSDRPSGTSPTADKNTEPTSRVPFAERPMVAAVIVFSPIVTAVILLILYVLLTK